MANKYLSLTDEALRALRVVRDYLGRGCFRGIPGGDLNPGKPKRRAKPHPSMDQEVPNIIPAAAIASRYAV